ncbi:iron chelate uptake ABC transporter family permease subunit [Enterococcus faecalis]
MRRSFRSMKWRFFWLLLAVVGVCWLYLTYHTYGNWSFALALRGKKLAAFVLVGIAAAFSTISFQTMTQNHFLTPNILGLDSLYVFVQTFLFFTAGGQQMAGTMSFRLFLLNVVLMVGISVGLAYSLLRKSRNDLFLLLMVGMILGTFFHSLSTFLQVIMDPNEYDLLQGKLFASFGNVNSQYLLLAGCVIIGVAVVLWHNSYALDVLHLGQDQAQSLGISLSQFQLFLLLMISLLVGLSTALVGPVTFLGFIVANISYQMMDTFQHRPLFAAGSLIAILFLVCGQFFIEHLFQLTTTVSVVIEFTGGVYFVGKIIRERKQQR